MAIPCHIRHVEHRYPEVADDLRGSTTLYRDRIELSAFFGRVATGERRRLTNIPPFLHRPAVVQESPLEALRGPLTVGEQPDAPRPGARHRHPLVLAAVAGASNHGYGVARWIRETTDDAFVIEDGALEPPSTASRSTEGCLRLGVLRCTHLHALEHMSTTLSVRIDVDTKKRLEALAKRSRRSKSFLAAEAIAAFVDAESWQLDEIQAGLMELDGGQGVPHKAVANWLRSWGARRERKAPRV